MWVLFTKQDLLPDSQKREIMQRLRALFEDEIRKISSGLFISIVDIPGMNALDRAKLHAVLDHVNETLDNEGNRASSIASQPKVATAQKLSEAELTTKINEAASAQPTSEIFWHDFQDGVITSWDHYAHLRSGYFVMLKSTVENCSIMDCADEFLGHLSRLRQANPQRFRNTAHRYD
jgi:ubiquitin carboxyl-terminal hydrolase L3